MALGTGHSVAGYNGQRGRVCITHLGERCPGTLGYPSDWMYMALEAPDASPNDRFGHSLAIDGKVLVAGAPQDDDLGSASGSAYVFRGNELEAKLLASDGEAFDRFGDSVALDGDLVAAVGTDKRVHLVDVVARRAIRALSGSPHRLLAGAFVPGTALLVTTGADGVVRTWHRDVAGGGVRLDGHVAEVVSAAFSADGERLVTGGSDGQVLVWDVLRGTPIHRFAEPTATVGAVALMGDGDTVVVASSTRTASNPLKHPSARVAKTQRSRFTPVKNKVLTPKRRRMLSNSLSRKPVSRVLPTSMSSVPLSIVGTDCAPQSPSTSTRPDAIWSP